MTEKYIQATIDILGKPYAVRCREAELPLLQQAAKFLDQEMSKIKDSGKVINLERIAIITALNVAHQFLELKEQKTSLTDQLNQRLSKLHDKLDGVINKTLLMEL